MIGPSHVAVEVIDGVFAPAPATNTTFDRHYVLASKSGVVRLEAEGRRWTLPPSRAALIAAGVPIEVSVLREVVATSFLVTVDASPPPCLPLAVFSVSPLCRALLDEVASSPSMDDDLHRIVRSAMVEVAWRDAADPIPLSIPVGRSPAVRAALAHTESSLGSKLTMAEIADAVSMAPRTLARRFDEELGMTWQASLRLLRILRATELLGSTDRSVSRIAFDVGYGSLSAFNAAFLDLIGRTPSRFRAELGS